METHNTKININFELIRYLLLWTICPNQLQMTIFLERGPFWPTIYFTRESESDKLSECFCKCLCSLGKLLYLIINNLKIYLWFSGYAYLHNLCLFSKGAVVDMTSTFLVLITTLMIRSTQTQGNIWWVSQILTMLILFLIK